MIEQHGYAARRWRSVALLSIALLAVLTFVWQLWPSPTANGALRALMLCIPLLLPLWGIARGNRYTYRWATLCVMPYFIVGMTEVIANPAARSWSAAMLLFALVWFASLVGFLRSSR